MLNLFPILQIVEVMENFLYNETTWRAGMKKIFLSIMLSLGICFSVNAAELISIPYNNLKEETKLKLFEDTWTAKVDRKDTDYFIKFISDGSGSYSEFYKSDGTFAFTTGCQYEFIHNGDLIGYSNQDLKFYDFSYNDGMLNRRELTPDEVQTLFPDYKIIKISEFSPNTNSLKVKKEGHNFKIIILNDTDRNFYHYSFTSGNAKFKVYPLTGFINVTKKGMIQFSHFGDNTKSNPWFILLVR